MKQEIFKKAIEIVIENNIIRQKVLRNILIVSGLLSTVLPAYMFLIIYPSFASLLIESTKESAVRAATHLKSMVFFGHSQLNKEAITDHFVSGVETIKRDMDLKKLKIFAKSGEILFSSDSAEIGNINKQRYFHEIVAKGKVFTQIIQKNTETLEGQRITSDVVETYVPIMAGDSFQGAFEIYYDITTQKKELEKLLSHSSILLLTLSFGFLLVVIIILIKENITIIGRKQAEEELQRAHRELKAKAAELNEANAELSQYAHVVSHDLQAPFRAISNYVSFLQEDLGSSLESEQKEYLDALGSTAHEANELVHDLLEISRIGRRAGSFESVHTGTFLKELINSLSLPADVKITVAEDWPTIEADPVLLRQIFQNLIENAIKFNDSAETCVELKWRQHVHGNYEFLVSDNGIGIEPRYHEQIFRVFERLHTGNEFKGTGIGLAIAKKAVSKLGGSIRVESKLGEGSTFFVTHPKARVDR